MTFGEISIDQAQDTILAHSLKAGEARLRKGRKLTSDDVDLLRAAGVQTVWAARLSGDDVHEDEAANALAAAMVAPGISARAPFTGRANLQADARGLVSVDAGLIAALNQIDEGITLPAVWSRRSKLFPMRCRVQHWIKRSHCCNARCFSCTRFR